MKKKTKFIVSSAMTMAVCASLIAGSTLALFTSESNVNIAITSGKVDVEASVTSLSTYSNATDDIEIDKISEWKAATSESDGTFTGNFDMGGQASYATKDGAGELTLTNFIPGDAVKFTLSIEDKSTISVKYQIRMLVGEETYVGEEPDPHPDTKLSSALEVKLGENDVQEGFTYAASAWASVDTTHEIPTTDVIIRLPKDVGNDYQERSCSITLTVLAVQGNAKESFYCDEAGHKYEGGVCIYCGDEFFGDYHSEEEGTYIITGAPDEVTELEIPGEINGKHVAIAEKAFENNEHLQSVVIDEGVSEIPTSAFSGCTNLTEVALNSEIDKIGSYAFKGCTSLTSVTIDGSVESTDVGAFYGCTSLEKVDFGNVHKIGNSTFYGCSSLQEADLTEVTSMAHQAFDHCSALETVTIGKEITEIRDFTFRGCENLTEITIPGNVKSIWLEAFSGCTSLSSVTIEEGVESLGKQVFKGAAITEIRLPESLKELGDAFANCDQLETVYIGGENSNLEKLYNFFHPQAGYSPTYFSSFAFENCGAKLKKIVFAGSKSEWDAMATCVGEETQANGKLYSMKVAEHLFKNVAQQITIECNDETFTFGS